MLKTDLDAGCKNMDRRIVVYACSITIFIMLGLVMHYSNGIPIRSSFTNELIRSLEWPSERGCYDVSLDNFNMTLECKIGDQSENIDFIVIGDSHSLAFRRLFAEIAENQNTAGLYVGASSCIPLINTFVAGAKEEKLYCYQLNQAISHYIDQNPVRKLFLISNWSLYTQGDYSGYGQKFISVHRDNHYDKGNSITTFRSRLKDTIEFYSSKTEEIIILTQPPLLKSLPDSIYHISKLRGLKLRDFGIDIDHSISQQSLYLNELNKYENVIRVYNLSDKICDEEVCIVGNDNKSYYYDDDHLSYYGTKLFENDLKKILQ